MAFWNAPDDSSESEKIDYVYRRLKAKEMEERLNTGWKWGIRALIVYGLFQLYLNPGAILTPFANGDFKNAATKAIADIATPIALQMASEMGTTTNPDGASGGSSPTGGTITPANVAERINNLSPAEKSLLQQELEKRKKNVPSP